MHLSSFHNTLCISVAHRIAIGEHGGRNLHKEPNVWRLRALWVFATETASSCKQRRRKGGVCFSGLGGGGAGGDGGGEIAGGEGGGEMTGGGGRSEGEGGGEGGGGRTGLGASQRRASKPQYRRQ